MQDLSRTASQTQRRNREPEDPAEPLESRWQIALQNIDGAEDRCQRLERTLEGALYLDATEWQSAVPASKQQQAHMALQTRIQALERMLAEARASLAASEAARREADSRVQELESIVESNAKIFELHHDALLEKNQTIQELETVISALSMGVGEGGGKASPR